MKDNKLLFDLILPKLGYESLDTKTMFVNFYMCRDNHHLCDKDFIKVKDFMKSALGEDGLQIINDVAILNWLMDIPEEKQLEWGIYFVDDKPKLLTHVNVSCLYGNPKMYYRYHGVSVTPSDMFHIASDWGYLKRLYSVYENLYDTVINSDWVFTQEFSDIPFAVVINALDQLSDKKHLLDKLFLIDIGSSADFMQWLRDTFVMDDAEIKSLVEMQDSTCERKAGLFDKVKLYIDTKAEVC